MAYRRLPNGWEEETQLPFPVMGLDINLLSIDHPDVAFDSNRFMRLFLANYCKALSRALNCKNGFH